MVRVDQLITFHSVLVFITAHTYILGVYSLMCFLLYNIHNIMYNIIV